MSNDDDLDSIFAKKLRDNLMWSLIFFCFNWISEDINRKLKNNTTEKIGPKHFQKDFFKGWVKFARKNMIQDDLTAIHGVLTTPKNVFRTMLRNANDPIESTEVYQDLYNKNLLDAEKFFFKSIGNDD